MRRSLCAVLSGVAVMQGDGLNSLQLANLNAVLAVGLMLEEFRALRKLLDDIGANDVDLVSCSADMLTGSFTLGQAFTAPGRTDSETEGDQTGGGDDAREPFHSLPLGTKRVIFLSGFYASEIIDVVGAVRESEIAPGVAFAAVVPKSWDRSLIDVVHDVYEGERLWVVIHGYSAIIMLVPLRAFEEKVVAKDSCVIVVSVVCPWEGFEGIRIGGKNACACAVFAISVCFHDVHSSILKHACVVITIADHAEMARRRAAMELAAAKNAAEEMDQGPD